MSVEAARMTADMLETAGLPAALGWRIRLAQLKPAEMEYRFAWARTALKIHDLRSAADALGGVNDSNKSSVTYHKLAGALAWELHKAAEAETQYTEALRLEPTNASITLNLATIHLASTNKEIANAARLFMEQLAATTNCELRTTALQYLASDANAHKLFDKAIGYSRQLLQDPSATFADRIVHLQFLLEAKSDEAASWLAALEKEARSLPASAFLFGKWMAATDNPATALAWLQSLPPNVQTNEPVPLIVTDCQVALQDWSGLLALVNKEDWGELTAYRLALESLARRSLGKDTAATAALQKALRRSAHRLDSLSRLAQVTSAWRWIPEHSEVLEKITADFPKETWAADQLVAQLYAQGDTRGIQTLLTKIQASDPSNARLKNNLANVFLLRNAELPKAYHLAKEAYDSAPGDPFFASTYAYPDTEVFLPCIRYQRRTRSTRVWTTEALFQTYLFARFDLAACGRRIRHAHAVLDVVHFGARYPIIPDMAIEELRRALGGEQTRVVTNSFDPGELVRIADGPFHDLEAVVIRAMPSHQRVAVLLDFLGRQTTVELDETQLMPVVERSRLPELACST